MASLTGVKVKQLGPFHPKSFDDGTAGAAIQAAVQAIDDSTSTTSITDVDFVNIRGNIYALVIFG